MRTERGVALVLAVVVLTVIGALVAAAFFAGTQEQRMAEHTRRAQQALGAAEVGLSQVLRQWPEAASSLGVYPAESLAIPTTPTHFGTGEFSGFVYRFGRDLYVVDITGRDRADRARQRLGLLVRSSVPCDTLGVDGVELPRSKCHIDNAFPKSGAVMPLATRSWIQLF